MKYMQSFIIIFYFNGINKWERIKKSQDLFQERPLDLVLGGLKNLKKQMRMYKHGLFHV